MSYPLVTVDDGVTRQVLSENEQLMVVAFNFPANATGALHNHPHVQSTYVESGKFIFRLGGEEHQLSKGDSLVIPSDIEHGCVCIEEGTLIDTFAPRRDDFL